MLWFHEGEQAPVVIFFLILLKATYLFYVRYCAPSACLDTRALKDTQELGGVGPKLLGCAELCRLLPVCVTWSTERVAIASL